MMELNKDLNLTEEELDRYIEEVKKSKISLEELFEYADLINIPDKQKNIKEDALNALWEALENAPYRDDSCEYIDLP